jgi:hypothetical protein
MLHPQRLLLHLLLLLHVVLPSLLPALLHPLSVLLVWHALKQQQFPVTSRLLLAVLQLLLLLVRPVLHGLLAPDAALNLALSALNHVHHQQSRTGADAPCCCCCCHQPTQAAAAAAAAAALPTKLQAPQHGQHSHPQQGVLL